MQQNYKQYNTVQSMKKLGQKSDFFGNNTMTLMLAAGMLSVTVVIVNLFFI